ncbi:putative disease resistance protein RGA1 [Humulus lupulus]|uniref:putative disease resistance protein RGA1 n=1 Tax=Humulus lupulus TaxID=3486 RepID=UPI002B407021|nr:putative disease resistance protein RGA1 [Humulus lupulus]
MAAGNLSVVAGRILELLNSEEKVKAMESLSGAHKEFMQRLKDSISEIEPVLLDAEKKSQRDNNIKDWLMELEHVLYNAENLLCFYTQQFAKQVRSDFFASSKRKNMLQEINEVREELGRIVDQRKLFDLEVVCGEEVVIGKDHRSENQSDQPIEDTLRNEDITKIIRILLGAEDKEKIGVLPVVGRAGTGKTRVAKLVYEDEAVKTNFEPRIWVFVSEIFDVELILRKILAKLTGKNREDLPSNQKSQDLMLARLLSGKKYFMVLDDVHETESRQWSSLMESLEVGALGSKILVTTPSNRVADLVKGSLQPYLLEDLSLDNYLFLFGKFAFGDCKKKIEDRSHQIRLGMEIVRRCAGRTLVITAMAAMLHSRSVEQWRLFYKNEFSKIGEYTNDHNEMLSLLKLCYDHLPSPLKHCFAFCSLFPKGQVMVVQTLIKLWMAQGFIIEKSDKSAEDVGYEYVQILVGGYFFEVVERDAAQQVTKCKLHRFMYDLAVLVTGGQCLLLSSADSYDTSRRTLHVCFDFDLSSTEFIAALDVKKTRTIVLSGQSRRRHGGRYGGIHVNIIFDKICSKFKFLLALDMHDSGIEIVPDSISKLKLLKYLDLSENEGITELPNSITRLLNLQTLRLSSCFKLKKLPEDFSNLTNLRHLEIDGCNNLTNLPRGIDQVHDLEALSQLVVREDSSKSDGVLKKLRELSKLPIRNLRLVLRHEIYVTDYLKEVSRGIRSLSLETEGYNLESEFKQTCLNRYLSSDLEELSINGFRAVSLFCRDSYFPGKLVKLSLRRCANCKNLPAVQLSSLKVLVLDDIPNLEYIADSYSSSSTTCFSTLEELWLTELPKFKGWSNNEINELPSFCGLSKLVIEDCPNLAFMPRFPNLEKGLVVDRISWTLFEQTMNQNVAPSSSTSLPPLSNLKILCIVGIKDCIADQIRWKTLKKLQFLKFDCLPTLKILPDDLRELTGLQELHIWRCVIKKLPDWINKLQSLEKLVIHVCPFLEELPEEISSLPNLKTLEIEECNTLLRRCEEKIGADWSKIAKIPERKLGLISGR